MPEQAGHLDAVGEAFRVGLPHPAARTPEKADDERAADDVQGVQAGEREIDRRVGVMPGAVIVHFLDFRGGDGDFVALDVPGFGPVHIHQVRLLVHLVAVNGHAAGLFFEVKILRFPDQMTVGEFAAGQRDFVMHELVVILE